MRRIIIFIVILVLVLVGLGVGFLWLKPEIMPQITEFLNPPLIEPVQWVSSEQTIITPQTEKITTLMETKGQALRVEVIEDISRPKNWILGINGEKLSGNTFATDGSTLTIFIYADPSLPDNERYRHLNWQYIRALHFLPEYLKELEDPGYSPNYQQFYAQANEAYFKLESTGGLPLKRQ